MIKETDSNSNYKHFIYPEQKFCYVSINGKANFEQSIQAMRDVAFDPLFKVDYSIIVDLREINFHPKYDELMGIKETLIELRDSFQGRIVLIPSPVIAVVVQLISVFADLGGLNIKTYSDINKAFVWLGVNKDILKQV